MYCKEEKQVEKAYSGIIFGRRPFAKAMLGGTEDYPHVKGSAKFFATPMGMVVSVEIFNLPKGKGGYDKSEVYRFDIKGAGKRKNARRVIAKTEHKTESQSESESQVKSENQSEIYVESTNDFKNFAVLPPLFSNNGYAWCTVLTDKLSPEDIMDREAVLDLECRGILSKIMNSTKLKVAKGIIRGA